MIATETTTVGIAVRHLAVLGLGTWATETGAIIAMVPVDSMRTVRVWSEDAEAHLAVAVADEFGYPLTTSKLEAHGCNRAFIEGIIDLAVQSAIVGR